MCNILPARVSTTAVRKYEDHLHIDIRLKSVPYILGHSGTSCGKYPYRTRSGWGITNYLGLESFFVFTTMHVVHIFTSTQNTQAQQRVRESAHGAAAAGAVLLLPY